jgi:drug/metabolite transporter (DMT)-like permease
MTITTPTQTSTKMSVPLLFLIPTLIWGSTWLVITFQLGIVAPEVSVCYRFALAALTLAAWCMMTGRSLRFTARNHVYLIALGLLMMGFNYIWIYRAEQYLTSGLVAVLFSTLVFMSPVAMRVAFGTPLRVRTFVAATFGVTGVALLFLPQLRQAQQGGAIALGVGMTLAATGSCAIGNLVAVRNHRAGFSTLPATVWGMAYGSLLAGVVAVVQGVPWTFDPHLPYVLSLAYLALFGSVIAFCGYFTLLNRVGAGPAAYTTVATPVIAMALSTFFEGYRWDAIAVLGVALAAFGNWLSLRPAAKSSAT